MLFIETLEHSCENGACPRCHGSLVLDDMSDVKTIVGRDLCFGLRCLNCGSVLDPLMGYIQQV